MKHVKYSVIVEVKDNINLEELKSHLNGGIYFIEDEGRNMDERVEFLTMSSEITELS